MRIKDGENEEIDACDCTVLCVVLVPAQVRRLRVELF